MPLECPLPQEKMTQRSQAGPAYAQDTPHRNNEAHGLRHSHEFIGSVKTDPGRFKKGFEEGLLPFF